MADDGDTSLITYDISFMFYFTPSLRTSFKIAPYGIYDLYSTKGYWISAFAAPVPIPNANPVAAAPEANDLKTL